MEKPSRTRDVCVALPLRTMLPPTREQDLQQELAWCPRSVCSPPRVALHTESAHVYNYATCTVPLVREFRAKTHDAPPNWPERDPFLHTSGEKDAPRVTHRCGDSSGVGNSNLLASSSNPRVENAIEKSGSHGGAGARMKKTLEVCYTEWTRAPLRAKPSRNWRKLFNYLLDRNSVNGKCVL